MSVHYATPESRSSTDTDHSRRGRDPDVPTCAYCSRWRNPNRSVEGSYCSERCYFAHRGRKALKNIKTDHTLCASCMARVKELERPPDSLNLPECVVGYQYATPEAERVTREYGPALNAKGILKRRLGCSCGATDLSVHDETLAETDLERMLVNLVDRLVDKYHAEKLDERVDYRELFAAYRDTQDLEYSVGRGLYA